MKKQLLLLACALILSAQMWTGNQIQAQSCPDFKFNIKADGNNGYDPNITCEPLLPVVPDSTFQYSIRLGHIPAEEETEGLYHKMIVTENNALLFIHYAIVLQKSNHENTDNTEFSIRVLDNNGNLIDSCTQLRIFCFDIETGKDGWHSCDTGGNVILHKEWEKVTLSLLKYLNEEITLEILIGNCTTHYGYAYVALECRPMEITVNGCATIGNDTVGSLEAPAYLADYQWYLGTYPNGLPVSEDKGGKDSILYVMDYDFFNAERFDDKLDCYCTFKSYLDSNNPCEDYLSAEIHYTRPRTHIGLHPSSDRWATFTNQSYVPSSESMIDTAKTVWYIEDSIYYAHSQVKHQFSLEGSLKVVTLIVENTEGCITKKDFDDYEKLDVRLISNNSDYGSVVGEGVYDYYEVVTIQAIPNQGCEFLNWTKNGEVVSTENPFIFSIIEDVELVANFSQKFEVVADSTSVSITWVAVEDAHGYTVTIYSDEGRTQIVAVLEFDGDGNLLSTKQGKSTKSNDLSCTINDLKEGTTYYFSIIAYDNNKEVINEESGFFITKSETVGIAQVPESLISIYPNPTTGKLTIKNGESEINKIEIFTIFGKKLSTFNYKLLNGVEASTVEIDLSDFAKGVYILQINDKTAKVIKE